MRTNRDVNQAVYEAMPRVVGRAMRMAVRGASYGTVKWAMYMAVSGAIAQLEKPPHPGLALYLDGGC